MSWMMLNIAVGYLLSLLVLLLVLRGIERAYRNRFRHNLQPAPPAWPEPLSEVAEIAAPPAPEIGLSKTA